MRTISLILIAVACVSCRNSPTKHPETFRYEGLFTIDRAGLIGVRAAHLCAIAMYGVQRARASRAAPPVSTQMALVAKALLPEARESPHRETRHKLIKPALPTKNANRPESPKETISGPKPIFCPFSSSCEKISISTNHWQSAPAQQAEIRM